MSLKRCIDAIKAMLVRGRKRQEGGSWEAMDDCIKALKVLALRLQECSAAAEEANREEKEGDFEVQSYIYYTKMRALQRSRDACGDYVALIDEAIDLPAAWMRQEKA